ncbi:MAG: epoxyqueuosine reductase QueH [Ruminococcaceae bacterium]|nr:epoxyqueuosine reductase QueH [Oscillospiraceae bacterium]
MKHLPAHIKMEKLLIEVNALPTKPRALIHSCCAPCSTHVLNTICDCFSVSVLFYNPNIFPNEEYQKRKSEQKRFIEILNRSDLSFYDIDSNHSDFLKAVKGYESEEEGGARCGECFRLRIRETAKKASLMGFEYFGTTLSVSPMKNSDLINKIGEEAEREFNVKWIPANFKKKDGYLKSIQLSKKYNLYRQNYCGCEFSFRGGDDA